MRRQVLRFGDWDDFSTRVLEAKDLSFIRSLAQDARVVRYVGAGVIWSDDYVERRFDEALKGGTPAGAIRWFIGETPLGERVGLLALTKHDDEVEIGYWVAPEQWNKGYAGRLIEEALMILADSACPVSASVHRGNVASRRVLERAGFALIQGDGTSSSLEVRYRRRVDADS